MHLAQTPTHQSNEPLSGLVPGYPGAEIHLNEVTTLLNMLSNIIWSLDWYTFRDPCVLV